MITGYIIFNSQKYFCGMGNTRRTAQSAAIYNAQEVEKCQGVSCLVRYTSADVNYPDFTELLNDTILNA